MIRSSTCTISTTFLAPFRFKIQSDKFKFRNTNSINAEPSSSYHNLGDCFRSYGLFEKRYISPFPFDVKIMFDYFIKECSGNFSVTYYPALRNLHTKGHNENGIGYHWCKRFIVVKTVLPQVYFRDYPSLVSDDSAAIFQIPLQTTFARNCLPTLRERGAHPDLVRNNRLQLSL